jgi:ABC-type transporter MlaC component
MKLRHLAVAFAVTFSGLTAATGASADAASESYVAGNHARLTALLRQPATATRDASVNAELAAIVDYDAMAQRAFGQPCAAAGCTNHWAQLTTAQQAEVRGLMRRLVEKNYKKNLAKTLDYEMTIRRSTDTGNESRVRTQAKSKTQAREAPTSVDYVVSTAAGAQHVVDIITEGSSLTKNYYQQFHELLIDATKGYPTVVKRLTDRINEP